MEIKSVNQLKKEGLWIGRWFSAPGLIPVVAQLGENIVGIEIGVSAGENIVRFLDAIPNIKTIYAIDPWLPYIDCGGEGTAQDQENIKLLAMENLKEFGELGRVFVFENDSESAFFKLFGALVSKYNTSYVDYIFVDGNHDEEFIFKDLTLYTPLVRPGGIVAGHDWNLPSTRNAVNEYRKIMGKENEIFYVDNQVWYWKKDSER